MNRLGVGCVLLPDPDHLALMRRIIEEQCDFYEISPETLWTAGVDGKPAPLQPYFDTIRTIVERSGRPVVGHGLDFSPGSPIDPAHVDAWLDRIRADHEIFRFAWYSEHLGYTCVESWQAVLPLPIPQTDEAVAAVAARLAKLRTVVPDVAFENQTWYYSLGDVRREPEFFNRLCRDAKASLLLDLHNAYSQCVNTGIDFDDYVGRLDLDRVIEIHLSGGSESDPAWLPSGRIFRLDTHDAPVPEPVWKACEHWMPKCKNVRGVVLERLDGTLTAEEVPAFESEFDRLREIWNAAHP